MDEKQLHLVGIFIGAITLAAVVMLSDGQWTRDESWFVAGATSTAALILLLKKVSN